LNDELLATSVADATGAVPRTPHAPTVVELSLP
jgi:hypothetical protein